MTWLKIKIKPYPVLYNPLFYSTRAAHWKIASVFSSLGVRLLLRWCRSTEIQCSWLTQCVCVCVFAHVSVCTCVHACVCLCVFPCVYVFACVSLAILYVCYIHVLYICVCVLSYRYQCRRHCPQRTFEDRDRGVCQGCPSQCTDCRSNTLCLACQPGHFLHGKVQAALPLSLSGSLAVWEIKA